MKKQSEIYRDQDPYSRMVMTELHFLRGKTKHLEQELELLGDRHERLKGVLYVTFMFSTLGILLLLENILSPWLRTL